MVGVLWGIFIFLGGVIFGWIMEHIINRPHPVGNLRIDNSDPDDGPYLFLELSSESTPNILKLKKFVTLEVKVENYISQQ